MKKIYIPFLIISITLNAQAKVDYVANSGVLLSWGEKKICIDCLFVNGLQLYEAPDMFAANRMINNTGEFANISHVLITHRHEDHMSSRLVWKHLVKNKRAKVITSNQVIENLSYEIDGQLHEVSPNALVEWQDYKEEDLVISAARMIHPHKKNGSVVNLAYIVDMEGHKYLHIGDASITDENFSSLGFENLNFEEVFLPFWFFVSDEGVALVKKYIKTKKINIIHVQKGFDLNKIDTTGFGAKVHLMQKTAVK